MDCKFSDEVLMLARHALGLERLPLVLTEKQVEELGIRSVASLRRDRTTGKGARIPYIKEGGLVKYPTHLVLGHFLNQGQQ